MKVRKLQLVGGSSYMVSLPKEWVYRYKLKQGDELILNDFDDFIVIQPNINGSREVKVGIKKMPSYETSFLKRFFGAIYSLGADRIVIEDPEVGKYITDISDLTHHYIGMEVLDASESKIIVHCFTIPDFDVVTIIKRMFQILKSLISEIEDVLEDNTDYNAFEKKIRSYENDFDRLYLLSVRIVNKGMKRITVSEWDEMRSLLGSRIISKFCEEIADILFIMTRYLKNHDFDRRSIKEHMKSIKQVLEMGFESFRASDISKTTEFLTEVEKVSNKIQKSIEETEDGIILKEFLLQICRMLESIGEITFNKCVREMLKKNVKNER
ncbi:AbrB/MazE/SpoVT family DNA-binding domain-containing protein [Archaeoglobus sulfaticallidus]|nr:phosphate uptake regulator PhoU [Archaeoglobus sulfaticallidus]